MKLDNAAKKLETKIVEMEIQKPLVLKVKTPLEREIARLKGYGDAKPLENVVSDF